MVTQTRNPSQRETEAGRLGAQSQPGLTMTLSRREGGEGREE